MKYAVESIEKVVPDVDAQTDMLTASAEFHQSWMDLDTSVRQLDAIQQIVLNIDSAMTAISKYGSKAIDVVNADDSLENLLGIEAKLITAEKAAEGLGDAFNSGIEKFKRTMKAAIEAIRKFFKSLFDRITTFFREHFSTSKFEKGSADYDREFCHSIIPKGYYIAAPSVTVKTDDIISSVHDLGVCAKELIASYGKTHDLQECEELFDAIIDKFSTDEFLTANDGLFKKSDGKLTWEDFNYTKPDHITAIIKSSIDSLAKAKRHVDETLKALEAIGSTASSFDDTSRHSDSDIVRLHRKSITVLKTIARAFRDIFHGFTSMTLAFEATHKAICKAYDIESKEHANA